MKLPKKRIRKLSAVCASIFATAVADSAVAGQSVTLSWNANTETNLAGYRLYYGTGSRSYFGTVQVTHPTTNATVTGLSNAVTYFFAVTAYTTDGLESDYSDEVSYRVPGLPPQPPQLQTNQVAITVTLEEACDPAGPWESLTNTFTILQPLDARFYRARMEVRR